MKRPDVVGTGEAAKILGVPVPVVNRKKNAGRMPPPAAVGAATMLWHRGDIAKMARSAGEWKGGRERPLDLVGTAEAAEIAGVNRSQIGRWVRKNPGFPSWAVRVAAGPFWWRQDIERFVAQRGTVEEEEL